MQSGNLMRCWVDATGQLNSMLSCGILQHKMRGRK
jgi:hypothetical protein